jgi:hypothetical protein
MYQPRHGFTADGRSPVFPATEPGGIKMLPSSAMIYARTSGPIRNNMIVTKNLIKKRRIRKRVSRSSVAGKIYDALYQFYNRHMSEDTPIEDNLGVSLWGYTSEHDILYKRVQKPTPEEEKDLIRICTKVSDKGEVTGADHATRLIQRNRKFFADIQSMIDLVEAVLAEADAGINWDEEPRTSPN